MIENATLPNVLIVGCGALGSHAALLLRNEASLVLVDGDRVEAKNVLSQVHGKSGVGKNKAQALQGLLNFLSGVKTSATACYLTAANVTTMTRGAALVVDCTDAVEPRTLLHREAQKRGLPVLHAALAAGDQGYGQVTWDSDNYRPDANEGAAPTCRAGENLPTAALVAAYAARSAQIFLREGRRLGFAVSASGGAVVL